MQIRSKVTHATLGGVILLLTVGLLWHSYNPDYRFNPLIEVISTIFVPRLLLYVILCTTVLMIVKEMWVAEDRVLLEINLGRFLASLIVVSLTSAGFWYLGFAISMPIGMYVLGLVLGYRNHFWLVLVSVAGPLIFWLALGYFASLPIPVHVRLL